MGVFLSNITYVGDSNSYVAVKVYVILFFTYMTIIISYVLYIFFVTDGLS